MHEEIRRSEAPGEAQVRSFVRSRLGHFHSFTKIVRPTIFSRLIMHPGCFSNSPNTSRFTYPSFTLHRGDNYMKVVDDISVGVYYEG